MKICILKFVVILSLLFNPLVCNATKYKLSPYSLDSLIAKSDLIVSADIYMINSVWGETAKASGVVIDIFKGKHKPQHINFEYFGRGLNSLGPVIVFLSIEEGTYKPAIIYHGESFWSSSYENNKAVTPSKLVKINNRILAIQPDGKVLITDFKKYMDYQVNLQSHKDIKE